MKNIKEVRCSIHRCLIGKYDERYGLNNVIFYCYKCKREYSFKIEGKKSTK